jgi:hypothetical protein
MYKTRITQWGLIKNYKATERQSVVRVIKEHCGSGIGCSFALFEKWTNKTRSDPPQF